MFNTMDSFLDILWDQILILSFKLASLLDLILTPVEPLGPTAIIFLLALAAVIMSRFFNASYTTKRHRKLEKNFQYWYDIRQQASNHADREKGRAMAKNIDQAELNRAYYDYFFEGFLKSLLTTWLPILLMLAYVNLSYSPEALEAKFGNGILFVIYSLKASAIFWYFVSVVFSFILLAVVSYLRKRNKNRQT